MTSTLIVNTIIPKEDILPWELGFITSIVTDMSPSWSRDHFFARSTGDLLPKDFRVSGLNVTEDQQQEYDEVLSQWVSAGYVSAYAGADPKIRRGDDLLEEILLRIANRSASLDMIEIHNVTIADELRPDAIDFGHTFIVSDTVDQDYESSLYVEVISNSRILKAKLWNIIVPNALGHRIPDLDTSLSVDLVGETYMRYVIAGNRALIAVAQVLKECKTKAHLSRSVHDLHKVIEIYSANMLDIEKYSKDKGLEGIVMRATESMRLIEEINVELCNET